MFVKALKYFLLILSVFTSGKVLSQNNDDFGFLEVKGSTFYQKKPFAAATIQVYRDGKKYDEIKGAKKGKFDLELDYGHEYVIKFISVGHIPMYMNVSTKIPKSKLPLFATYVIDMVTFYDTDDATINPLAFNDPITKVMWYPKENVFRDDEDYLKHFAFELKSFDKINAIKNAEAMKKKAEEDARIAAELKAKQDQEARLLAEQLKHKKEVEQNSQIVNNDAKNKPAEKIKAEEPPQTFETEQHKALINKKAKEEQISRNKSVKQTYENDLIKTVAEETRRMREIAYLKKKGELEALEKIERINTEYSLKQSSHYIINSRKNAYLKLASYHAIKAVEMNRLILTIADNSTYIDEAKAKKGTYAKGQVNNFRPAIIHATEESIFKTTKRTTVKGLNQTDIYHKDTYLWGITYCYKNNIAIDEKTYLNETSKYIK